MVQPTAASSVQQNYLSPLPRQEDQSRSENTAQQNQQNTQANASQQTQNIEDIARQENENRNLQLSTQEPLTGSERSETTERGSLIDVLA